MGLTPNFEENLQKVIETQCYQALQKIKAIIEDDSLENPECFMKIEKIVCALEEVGSGGGFRHDFGHEIHFADVDNDGLDEIAFCTTDNINGGPSETNAGELVLLDHDGTVMLRKLVTHYINDTHFDDIAMADFLGNGSTQILAEKGQLLDLSGNIIWDLSAQMDHGQWITHAPGGKGKTVFISELWSAAKETQMKSMLFTGQGQKIRDIRGFPWPRSENDKMRFLPSRCHSIQWDRQSEPEFFFTQQLHVPGEFNCQETRSFRLKGLFMDLRGNLLSELPIDDAQIRGYYYNGETHSKVADVDGDGQQEIVFPKQDGHVMIIKRINRFSS